MSSVKFSQFTAGGDCEVNDVVVGLRDGENTKFTFPGDGFKDADGNYLLKYESAGTDSPNSIKIINAEAGNPPQLTVDSNSTNGDIEILPKDEGNILFTITGAGLVEVVGVTAIGVPVGTTAQRPPISKSGLTRYNTDSQVLEFSDSDDGVWKSVSSIAIELSYLLPATVATTTNLSATYDNGSSGVGATLTANSDGAASIDGVSLNEGDTVLFKDQSTDYENGLYELTINGTVSTPSIFTRSTQYDTIEQMKLGASFVILSGTENTQTFWTQNIVVATIGTDSITYQQDIGSFTFVEGSYLSGVTSNIQTQLDSKSPVITGAASTIVSSNLTANRATISNASGKMDVSVTTDTELSYVNGVTSSIQTQLNAKQATITGAASTIVSSNLTANRATISNASGKMDVSTTTDTELSYVSGVTSSIQTQINAKAPSASPTFTGTVTVPTPPVNATDAASKAYVDSVTGTGFTNVVIQVFTASGTYTPTSGMEYCIIEVSGGGGGGGGANAGAAAAAAGAGGGGGGYAKKRVTAATIGASQTVTVGSGGAAGTSAPGAGGTGGTSSVGAIVSATGGAGGTAGASNTTSSFEIGVAGGVGSSGDFNCNGGCSGPGVASVQANAVIVSGQGGQSYFGGGGFSVARLTASSGATAGTAGTLYGGGGAGAAALISASAAGGAGAAGIVIITEYIH